MTIVPLQYPDEVEVQALFVDAEAATIGVGMIYAPEPWQVWRSRLKLSETVLDDAEFTLARSEAAQLGALEMSLPMNLFGRRFVLQPC